MSDDIVKGSPTECTIHALQACITACKKHDISLQSVFHAASWGDQPAIYWLISNAKSDDPVDEAIRYRALKCLLKAPLNEVTRRAAYSACTPQSFQGFFSVVRLAKGYPSYTVLTYSPIAAKGERGEDLRVTSTSNGFKLEWAIPRLRARMRRKELIGTEFVSQGANLHNFFFQRC